MTKKIILALLLGLGVTIFFIQEDPWVHETIAQAYANAFSDAIGCSFSYKKVKNINLFIPSIELEDVVVAPKNGDSWSWKAQSYTTSCSWWHIFFYGMIDMHISIDTLNAHSYITKGEPAILEHIRAMATGPSIGLPMFIKSLTLKNCSAHLQDLEHALDIYGMVNSKSKKINHVWRSQYTILSGSMLFNNEPMIEQANGSLDIDIGNLYSKNAVRISGKTALSIPRLPSAEKTCYVSGQWQNGSGILSIKHPEGHIKADPLVLSYTDDHHILLDGTTSIPLNYIVSFVSGTAHEPVDGLCALRMHMHLDDIRNSLRAEYTISNAQFAGQRLAQHVEGTAALSNTLWQGTCNARIADECTLNGTWQWDADTRYGNAVFNNTQPIKVPFVAHWMLQPHESFISCSLAPDNTLNTQYRMHVTHAKTNDTLETTGSIVITDEQIRMIGALNERTYSAHVSMKPIIKLNHLSYMDEQGMPLITINSPADSPTFEGLLQFPFMRSLITKHIGYDVQGDGVFTISGELNNSKLNAKLALVNGNIRLPETYNFMNGCSAIINADLGSKTVALDNLHCTLHTGSVSCKRAIVQWDQDYKPSFVHIPVVFDSCLLNMKRDLFAIVSGALTLSQKPHSLPLLEGSIMIDRAQLKENLFSDALQHDLLQFTSNAFDTEGKDMACNITLSTMQPIKVNTAFLQASAKVNLHITQTMREPKVSGSVELLSGELHFPYKSLHITKGKIMCLPNQLTDPHIELVAKNTIKKHTVSLQVSGSLKDHHVLLESTPPLTEEQIVALLLVGSHQESLNAVMPALIMQNISSILFASDQSPLKITEYFNTLLKPFKYIHLTPSFSDQSGRGGLRGAMEVDIGDHWHALLQKNFSLTEDTRFEVEYLFSDDMSIRGVRDERKDVSAEVEMRWKF